MNKQKILIITAPSGSGKSTLIKKLMAVNPNLSFSISACTRAPRVGEQNGIDYHFMSVEQFKKSIAANEFLEWEMVYEEKYYGTLKSEIKRIWENGQTPLVDIDVKGAINVQNEYKGRALSIFIQAPSLEILKQRLEKRGTETEKSLAERIGKAKYELTFANQFDHTIINDNLEIASGLLNNLVKDFLNDKSDN
jgi:guanylate kinase